MIESFKCSLLSSVNLHGQRCSHRGYEIQRVTFRLELTMFHLASIRKVKEIQMAFRWYVFVLYLLILECTSRAFYKLSVSSMASYNVSGWPPLRLGLSCCN